MGRKMNNKIKEIRITVPTEIHQKLKTKAWNNGLKINEAIRQLIESYVKGEPT